MKNYLIALFVLLLAACQPNHKAALLSVKDFNEKLMTGGVVIIDVRSPEEYKEGYIKGAVNIDYNNPDFDNKISGMDKDATYYLYCLGGPRSEKALDKMHVLGFKNLYVLDGGIKAWINEKMPLEIPVGNTGITAKDSAISKDPKDFKTAIFGDKLVFVDFNATWCGPCKKMQPFVDMIKEERSKEVIVFSIDTDEQVELAKEYQVMNLPTVLLIKKGAVLYREEGYQDQASLNALVTKFK